MFKKMNALLWLRVQVLMSNSTLLATVLLPFGLAILYNQFLNKDGIMSSFILFTSLSMVLSMASGYIVSIMMAEDKEKHNLKSLMLSGVTALDYTVSMMILPLLMTVLGMIILPLYLQVDLAENILAYIVFTLFAGICVILLNLLVGAVSDTQSKAQVYSLFPIMAISFLPMIAVQNETAQKILEYSFIGPLANLFLKKEQGLAFNQVALLGVWTLVLAGLCLLVLKRSYQQS